MQKMDSVIRLDNKEKLAIKQSFMRACSDRKFCELISLLEADEELLMKYTSLLQDAAIEFENCKNCNGLSNCKNKVVGNVLFPRKDGNRIVFSYRSCHYHDAEKYKDNVSLFEVSKTVRDASLKDVYRDDRNRIEIVKYVKNFLSSFESDKKEKGMYLHGPFGAGKTYLIAALFNELAKKNIRSIVIHVPELIRSMKESFDTDYKERYEAVKKVPLLLLDDIGAEYLTAWARDEVLEPILDYRMQQELPTFFTSNFTLKELEKHFSTSNNGIESVKAQRIIERIKQLAVPIQLESGNRRG